MPLICPECRADLVVADAQNATCGTHGGQYQILFDRSAPPATGAIPPAPGGAPVVAQRGPTIFCVQHPEVPASTRCRVCLKGVCAICDFAVAGGSVHLCPACVEMEPATAISSGRRTLMIVGLVIAAFCLVLFVLGVSAAQRNQTAANLIFGVLILAAIAGTLTAMCALERRLSNSAGIWVAVGWNAVNLGILLIFTVVGLMRS